MQLDPAVLHLLGRQHWVASAEQLRELGVSRHALTRARTTGLVVPVMREIVRLAGAPDTFEARCSALCLRGGADTSLADVTAGQQWGLRKMPAAPVTLMIPERRRLEVPDWARVTLTSWPDDGAIVLSNGLVVTSPLRTLFMLASRFGPHRFEHAAEDAWHRGLVHPDEAREYLSSIRRQGRSGVRRFEQWLQVVGDRQRPSQSGLEVDLAQALARLGLPSPERQHPLLLPNGRLVHLDLAWPPTRLGVEPGHTWWHGGNEQMRADHERDRLCDQIGWRILRFDEIELRDIWRCARQIADIHRARSEVLLRATLGRRA